MPPNLLGLVIAAIGTILTVGVAVGIPALAIVMVRYLKLKERELTLAIESRQRSQEQDPGLEQRVRRLEEELTSFAHEVRGRLALDESAADKDFLEESAHAPAKLPER